MVHSMVRGSILVTVHVVVLVVAVVPVVLVLAVVVDVLHIRNIHVGFCCNCAT